MSPFTHPHDVITRPIWSGKIVKVSILLLVIFFYGFSIRLYGQSFDPAIPLSQLTYTQWTTADGLSSSNTTDVLADHHGMLWITSFNGYMVYDAERIEIYDKSNTSILETDGFLVVEQAPDLSLYFGTQGSGLIRQKNGVLEEIKSNSVNIPKSIRSLMIDDMGTLYFGGQNSGLYVMKNDSIYKQAGASISSVSILRIKKSKQGDIWIGTEGKGVFRLSNNTITNYDINAGLLSNYVSDIQIHEDGTVIVATPRGLTQIIPEGEVTTIKDLEGIYVNVFLFDDWQTIWLGGEAGLFRYHLTSGKLEKMESYRDIDFVRISSMTKDAQGSIWMTSSRFGLVNIKESLVFNLSEPQISSNRANIIHEDHQNRILIGTDQNHLEIWDNGKVEILPINTNLIGNGVRGIWDEPDGTLWLATYAGMLRVQKGKETLFSTTDGMPANTFRVVIKDKNENFWFGTRSGGLVKFKDDQIIKVFNLNDGLSSNFVLALAEGSNGEIFVGTNGGGMTIISPDESSKTYHVKEDDSGILIFNIDPQPENTAILTTNIGPAFFDGEKIIPVHLDMNGRSSTYFDIVWDQNNHLWLTTNSGIFKIEKNDWNDFLAGKIEKVPFVLINEMSGMNNRECTGATKATISHDGRLYFPTLGGVCIIDPYKPVPEYSESVMQIRKVIVDNKQFNTYEDKLLVGPGVNRLEFRYSLLSYQTIGQNRYRYQLKGFDESKSTSTSNPSVSYTNLPPGSYVFEVEGSTDGKKWSTIPATIKIEVLPHFYQTYLFIGIVIITIIILLILIYRWRLSFINRQNIKLKKVNAELDRFVYSASHELRSPLTSVLGIVSLAKEEQGDVTEYLSHIENSVKRLDSFIKDIIDYSRNTRLDVAFEAINFDELITNILKDISYTEHFKKIENIYQNNLTEPFYSDSKRLKIALSNLINNAVKHHDPDQTEQPFVKVSLSSMDGMVKIIIEDNGPGIEPEHQEAVFKMFYRATVRTEGSGLGLYIVKEIIDRLEGKIKLNSTLGKGTRFEIILPNRWVHPN